MSIRNVMHWAIAVVAVVAMLGTSASAVTTENFDPAGAFTAQNFGGVASPGVLPADAGSTGNFYRIVTDASGGQSNTISFDRTDVGPFTNLSAEFDFRIGGSGDGADGFGFGVLNTANFGTTGGVPAFFSEEANLAGSLGIGIDTHDNGGGDTSQDSLTIHHNGVVIAEANVTDVFDVENNVFNRARVTVTAAAGGGSFVSVSVSPDVNGVGGPAVNALTDVYIADLNPYEARIAFSGRTGGLDDNQDIDNINVDYNAPLAERTAAVPVAEVPHTAGFNVLAIKLGGGAADTQFNTTNETVGVWEAIDGGEPIPGVINANGTTYNIANFAQGTTQTVDYAGNGGGNFGVNLHPNSIGGGQIPAGNNEDYSILARAFMGVPLGTWTISAASDDGRILRLLSESGVVFDHIGGQNNLGAVGTNIIGHNDPTGHDQSVGVFTITEDDLESGGYASLFLDALFFERGGGDSFEISIAQGMHTDFSQDGLSFVLLEDGALGWIVSSQPIAFPVPEPGTATLALLGLGALVRRRRRIA